MINRSEMSNLHSAGIDADILPFPGSTDKFDLETSNETLRPLSARERIKWAVNMFGSGLHVLTSAGIDSALTLDHTSDVAAGNEPLEVTNVNTRLLPNGTLTHREALRQQYGFRLHEFSPTKKAVDDILTRKLWESDLSEYRQITKIIPLKRAIGALGVVAYISGVRRDQTEQRSTFNYVQRGKAGEIRVHPFIDWSQSEVNRYIDDRELPRHPLFYEGYTSLDDWPLMGPDFMKTECGIHLIDDALDEKAS